MRLDLRRRLVLILEIIFVIRTISGWERCEDLLKQYKER